MKLRTGSPERGFFVLLLCKKMGSKVDVSVDDELLHRFVGNAHIGTELLDGEDLVFRFVQRLFDFMDQSAAVSFAFSQDALYVFGIDADSGDSGFHRFVFLC